ncbi:hypothetical protein H0H93_006891 [Arthromyces matolae]|nr:hypothetical protein H0H93_006891 [Arthromyces matolae]
MNTQSSRSRKLPKNPTLEDHGSSLWIKILEAEKHAKNQPKGTASNQNTLIGIRVLGYLLLDLYAHVTDVSLGSLPYTRVRTEALSCLSKETDEDVYRALQTLGLTYRNYLLRVFRSNGGSQTSPSAHVSPPSFDRVKERILAELGQATQTRSSVRDQALLRDGYKCTLSGFYDKSSVAKYPELRNSQRDGEITVFTQVAHIFSESASQYRFLDCAGTVFAMLKMFGLENRARELYGAGVNDLHNVITMYMDFHMSFDRLHLWLEPVPGMANTYQICGPDSTAGFFTPFKPDRRVTFTVEPSAAEAAAKQGKTLSLPDPCLLSLRAACSRVAHLSGAAEHHDEILRDLEEITVLADDGSMADFLSHRISMVIPGSVEVRS